MITVILPTYNRPLKLKRAIESILLQSYKNFKILILDDCSNIDTENLVTEFLKVDERIFYHRQTSNIGGNRNFDFGLRLVDTDFFCFLSDDDYHLPNFFQSAIDVFNRYDDIGFYAGEVIYEDDNSNKVGRSNVYFKGGYHTVEEGLLNILDNTHPPCWTGIIFRSKVLLKTGYIDEQVEGSMDYDLVLKVAAYFPYYISTEIVAKFTVDPNSWGHSANYKYVWPSWIKMINNILLLNDVPLNNRLSFYSNYNNIFKVKIFLYARQNIKNKNYEDALKCAQILKLYFKSYLYYFIIYYAIILLKHFPFLHTLINKLNYLLNKSIHRNSR